MANQFRLDGIEDLKVALRMLPEQLTDQGGDIVRYWARFAAGAARASYPRRSGNLQDRVAVEYRDSGFGTRWGARAVVVNRAPHAYIYEYGTEARHYYTARGKKHETGAMPAAAPGRAFVPNMIRARDRMYADLVQLLVRQGLAVRGNWRTA
jgi:hypothetical protein